MDKRIADFFKRENIDYYAALPFEDTRMTAPHILERSGIAARSVLVFLVPYFVSPGENLSSYATSRDYHIYLSQVNKRLADVLREVFGAVSSCGFGDHSPIDERHAAAAAGLGVIGRNGLLINETYGSYLFIGEHITDIPAHLLDAKAALPPQSCEGCGACLSACPTGILRGEGGDCLSAITQKKGKLSEAEETLMRRCGTAWGCDICQDACPHNITARRENHISPIPFFQEDRILSLTGEALCAMSEEEFSARAFAWRKRETVERNVAILKKK